VAFTGAVTCPSCPVGTATDKYGQLACGDCPAGECRGIVVVASNEFAYKNNGENPNPPSADFNHNGVVSNVLVLFTYDTATGKLTNLGLQAFDFVVGGQAARVPHGRERDEDGLERNLSTNDVVMLVYLISCTLATRRRRS
jgi:hypothetical protein